MTHEMFIAMTKLANHIGMPLKESSVHLVKPLEGSKPWNRRGEYLKVYGVCTMKNGVRTFTFYCADYGHDRFKTITTDEKYISVRQNGDATLVGSKVIGW